jgi:hypothetical protein
VTTEDWIKGQLAKTCGGFYHMTMMHKPSMIMLIVLSVALATPAPAQTSNISSDNYSIMVPEKGSKQKVSKQKVSKQKVSKTEQPEPWLAPKYKSPRGTVEKVRIPKSKIVSPPRATDPGYVYVPQTGRTFQNLPSLPGSGSGGTQTSQDRAIRCMHQAGVYGQGGSYMGSCF